MCTGTVWRTAWLSVHYPVSKFSLAKMRAKQTAKLEHTHTHTHMWDGDDVTSHWRIASKTTPAEDNWCQSWTSCRNFNFTLRPVGWYCHTAWMHVHRGYTQRHCRATTAWITTFLATRRCKRCSCSRPTQLPEHQPYAAWKQMVSMVLHSVHYYVPPPPLQLFVLII